MPEIDDEDDLDDDWEEEDDEAGEDGEPERDPAGRSALQRAQDAATGARASLSAFLEDATVQAKAEAEIARAQAELADFRRYISQQPALQKLYDFLFAKYLAGLPILVTGFGNFEKWLWNTFRAELGIGAIGTAIVWRKRKAYMTFPITATAEQKVAALWEWVDYVLFQIYQVKNKVTVVGSTTTPEDQALLRRLKLRARSDAVTVAREKGQIPRP